jgi:hypothetical protein
MDIAAVRIVRALVVSVLTAGLVLGAAPRPALAQSGESITSYDVRIEVRPDGLLAITETIAYDFGAARRHGIIRKIPVRFRYDDRHDRIYPLDGVSVTMDGSAVPVNRMSQDGFDVLKIGDPGRTVTGTHSFLLSYSVRGVLNGFPDHDELYWNVVGGEWSVPIGSVSALIAAPATITRTACFAGPTGSTLPCADTSTSGRSVIFRQSRLGNGSGLTAVVGFPVGTVPHPAPILTVRRGVADAFRVTPWTVSGGLALALLGLAAALAVAWRVGRDRYYVGQLPGLVPGRGEAAIERRKPLVGAPPISVEFVPPEGIRPGQVGTLIDEKADVLDVTATIVDFAVRRHLHIRELRRPEEKRPHDWELTRLTTGDRKFLRYERTLFEALFDRGERVRLSELKNTFAADLTKVRSQLYTDMVSGGWYRQSPARTRAVAYGVAALVLVGALAVTLVLALATSAALVGVGLVLGAVALLAVAGRFPARTGRGSAALARVLGFRLYVATAEAEQLKFQEREQIFSAYLPYAMVFGLTERWASVFADLGAAGPDGAPGLYWYAGSPGWSMLYFSRSIGGFTATTSTAIASTPPSAAGSSGFGSGGFSGGGAGGGGGGSW